MQYLFRFRYLVVIDGNVNLYEYENYKFDQPFPSFQPKNIFIGKSKVFKLTDFSGVGNNSDFDVKTILLVCEDNEYI